MKTVAGITPDDTTVRTQITLTKRLKELIEQETKPRNQSLSEYLRQAAQLKLKKDRKKRKDLKKLADTVIGSLDISKHPEWSTEEKVIQWQKKMRAEWSKHG